jgi:hypothetical protein
MSYQNDHIKPEPTSYGELVDRMAARVSTWPAEYQRSVDVHDISVPSECPCKPCRKAGV